MLKISHNFENDNTGPVEVKQTEPYIIFSVDNEEFGVEAQKVLEMVPYMAPLKMLNPFLNVQGMASYRGKIIPIIDLRLIFGSEAIDYDDNTVSIVVQSTSHTFGITAERVLDLELIPVASIKEVSAFTFKEKTKFLKNVANFGQRLVLLLDLDKMIETKPDEPTLAEPVQQESLDSREVATVLEETAAEGLGLQGNIPQEPVPVVTEESTISTASHNLPQLTEERREATEGLPQPPAPEDPLADDVGPDSNLIAPEEPTEVLSETLLEPRPEDETEEEIELNKGDSSQESSTTDELLEIMAEIPGLKIETGQLIPSFEAAGDDKAQLDRPQPELVEAKGGDPFAESSFADDNQDLTDPEELRSILSQLRQGDTVDLEFPGEEGSSPFEFNSTEPTIIVESPEEGITEQIAEILSGLESKSVVELPEDLFQMSTTANIESDVDPTAYYLRDEELTDILTKLEAEIGMKSKEQLPEGDSSDLQLDQTKKSEER